MKSVKKIVLQEPFQELLMIQNQLCQQFKYYGTLLQKRLGTDTIPFVLLTTAGKLFVVNKMCFFRLEAVEDSRIFVRLLQGYSAESEITTLFKEVIYLAKTEEIVEVSLDSIAAIQLSDLPMQGPLFIESKW